MLRVVDLFLNSPIVVLKFLFHFVVDMFSEMSGGTREPISEFRQFHRRKATRKQATWYVGVVRWLNVTVERLRISNEKNAAAVSPKTSEKAHWPTEIAKNNLWP